MSTSLLFSLSPSSSSSMRLRASNSFPILNFFLDLDATPSLSSSSASLSELSAPLSIVSRPFCTRDDPLPSDLMNPLLKSPFSLTKFPAANGPLEITCVLFKYLAIRLCWPPAPVTLLFLLLKCFLSLPLLDSSSSFTLDAAASLSSLDFLATAFGLNFNEGLADPPPLEEESFNDGKRPFPLLLLILNECYPA
ncbi:Bud30p [Saccharomyces cerevisiae EC1118]|uniref:Bud30p n=2 Tax=Saccharomyces cerevisiae TaxID=4932 RepID=C8Z6F2_YEAS8|nr:hypothetical protein AWRI1631_40860 [Saccharomyces cerevisiae AWRI1631]CAY78357.1 Bud30p [Saccharomyces cerevisiae EC1118]